MKISLDAKTSKEKGARVTNELRASLEAPRRMNELFMNQIVQSITRNSRFMPIHFSHLNFFRSHAKILSQNQIQKGQFAWSRTHHRVHFGHQRLHARNLHMGQWLAGFTDGDGCFSIVRSSAEAKADSLLSGPRGNRSDGKYNINFSIAQSKYNIRVLFFIKKHIGVGSIQTSKNGAVYRVRNSKHLYEKVLPIFARNPLQTSKSFHAKRIQLATFVMIHDSMSTAQKRDCLSLLKSLPLPSESEWDGKQAPRLLPDGWIVGFLEAEGSFFVVIPKNSSRVCGSRRAYCSFAVTQKRDKPVLEAIRERFHVPSKVLWKRASGAFTLETKNQEALRRIDEFARGKFQGMKALEYKLWSRALYYQISLERGSDPKNQREHVFRHLEEIQNIMRKLKAKDKPKSV